MARYISEVINLTEATLRRKNSIAEYFPLAIIADHPKSDEYFSDPRLAAYAVPYKEVVSGYTVSCPRSLVSGVFAMRTDEIQPTC